jgi:high-affinity nickel-transport protein
VGGIIGASVSASFLFLIACLNIYFLTTALRERRRIKRLQAAGLPVDPPEAGAIQGGGCLVRIIGPVLRAVDRPWKMYPVGVLFGFGECGAALLRSITGRRQGYRSQWETWC